MRRGVWHQCGDRSQRLVAEQLGAGVGEGVILSPRDIRLEKAREYVAQYSSLGAHVLVDPQFYLPGFSNDKISSYPTQPYRMAVSQLHQVNDAEMDHLSAAIEGMNFDLSSNGIIAPAVLYEAGRMDIVALNGRLFAAAKKAGDALGVPTYASIVLGRSVTSSAQTLGPILSAVTSLPADGWYFGFEFPAERLPTSQDTVQRWCETGLTLACTGVPVLHAFTGPLSVLSFGTGAAAVGVGHSQNLWQFTAGRWEPQSPQGGGGNAPARFFSSALWGT